MSRPWQGRQWQHATPTISAEGSTLCTCMVHVLHASCVLRVCPPHTAPPCLWARSYHLGACEYGRYLMFPTVYRISPTKPLPNHRISPTQPLSNRRCKHASKHGSQGASNRILPLPPISISSLLPPASHLSYRLSRLSTIPLLLSHTLTHLVLQHEASHASKASNASKASTSTKATTSTTTQLHLSILSTYGY